MTRQSTIAQILTDVRAARDAGNEAIECDKLVEYLLEMERSDDGDLDPVEMEKYRTNLRLHVDAQRFRHEGEIEMFRSVIASGQGALKAAFILNGGAVIALLTFIGHLFEGNPSIAASLSDGILLFTLGVLFVGIASGGTYLSQWCYARLDPSAENAVSPVQKTHSFFRKIAVWIKKYPGHVLNIVVVLLVLASLGLFLKGLLLTHDALNSFTP